MTLHLLMFAWLVHPAWLRVRRLARVEDRSVRVQELIELRERQVGSLLLVGYCVALAVSPWSGEVGLALGLVGLGLVVVQQARLLRSTAVA